MPGQFDWMHPDAAKKVVGVITDIARTAVADASTFRNAEVTALTETTATINFVDEPGNDVFVSLGSIRPTFVGQRVEIEVRYGNQFVISQIFGDTEVAGNTPDPTVEPVGVTGLALVSAERSITATWDPLTQVDHYVVDRAKDAGFTTGLVTAEVQGNQWVVTNLLAGETWYYRVRAVNEVGNGPWSGTASVLVETDTPAPDAPGAVTGLTLSTIPKQITAKWDASDDAATYEVQRSPASNFLTGVVSEVPESNMLVVNGLQEGSNWFFRVRGVNDAGNGAWSGVQSITVMLQSDYTDGLAPADSPPVTVRAGLRMLTAEWPAQANDDPVTYEVHMGTVTNFAPSGATKLGETSSTFWITDHKPDGTPLVAGTTYFMRVIAKDVDGSAVVGAQGSGTPVDISQDVFYEDILGDGSIPGTPAAPVITSGIGYLYASWTRPTSPDPLQYEVHVSTNPAFVPDANTLSLVTGSLFGFIRKQGPGAGGAPLAYGITYYVKLVAVDIDGVSAPSPAGSGFTVQTNTPDIVVGAITSSLIYSGAVMADRIQATNIAAGVITSTEIYSGAVMANRIQAGNLTAGIIAVGTALIQNGAIVTAHIDDAQITNAKISSVSAGKITVNGTMTATMVVGGMIKTNATPTRGIEISSAGIYGYNSGGGTVFSVDSSGNAYFQGNIYAVNGTFTGNITSSASITGGSIYGAFIGTATTGARIELGPVTTTGYEMGYGYSRGPFPGISYRNGSGTLLGTMFVDTENGMVTWEVPGANHTKITMANDGIRHYGGGAMFFGGLYDGANPVYSPINQPPYPVNSVNGYTGYVNLNYSHVGAAAASHSHDGASWSTLTIGALYAGGNYLVGWTGTGMAFYYAGAGTRVACQNGNQILMRNVADNVYAGVTGGAYTNASSKKWKKNIKALKKNEHGLTKVRQLRPVTYQLNKDSQDNQGDKDRVGFIAEEVALIYPECVNYDEYGNPGIDYGSMVALMAVAIQELEDQVNALSTK